MKILIIFSWLCLYPSRVYSDMSQPGAVVNSLVDNASTDGEMVDTSSSKNVKVRVSKCCEFDSLLIESNLGVRDCKRRAGSFFTISCIEIPFTALVNFTNRLSV